MLALGPAAADLIRVVTGSAADVEPSIHYVTYTNATPPVVSLADGEPLASITSATNTTLLTGATNTYTVIKGINLYNRSATPTTVRVEHIDASDTVGLVFCTLLQDEALIYTESGLWLHLDANGAPYPSVGNLATQAEMEAGTTNDKYVSPGRAQFHPSAAKFWLNCGGTGTTLNASYNMTSITDITTPDGITATINVDFSSANWCCIATAQSANTTSSVANARLATTRDMAAGTIAVYAVDAAATSALQNPTNYHVAGYGDQ